MGPLAIMQKYVPVFERIALSMTSVVFFTTLKFFGKFGSDSAFAHVIRGFGFPIPSQTVLADPPSLTVMLFGFFVNSAPSVIK